MTEPHDGKGKDQLGEAIEAMLEEMLPEFGTFNISYEVIDKHLRPLFDALTQENERLVKYLAEYKDRYYDLIFCVGNKYENESRHDTAKRYLLNAERYDTRAAQDNYTATRSEGGEHEG